MQQAALKKAADEEERLKKELEHVEVFFFCLQSFVWKLFGKAADEEERLNMLSFFFFVEVLFCLTC